MVVSDSDYDSEMSFALSKPRKAHHFGPLYPVSVAAWRLNLSICPVKSLETYLDSTAALRDATNSASLFLSSNKPNGPAFVSTIGLRSNLKQSVLTRLSSRYTRPEGHSIQSVFFLVFQFKLS